MFVSPLTLYSSDVSQDKPVKGLVADQKPQIPRKPRTGPAPSNGADVSAKRSLGTENGVSGSNKRARNDSSDGSPLAKKAKVAGDGEAAIVIEDDAVISID